MDAQAWDERYAGADPVWSMEPNEFVARECADLSPGRAVDLACGEGRNAIWLARNGWAVTAVDFSPVGIDKGRRRLAKDGPMDWPIDWQVADATTWSTDDLFDLAVLAYLQLPAAERRAAVRAAYDALAPGGTFLLVAHDSTNIAEGTGGPKDPEVLMTAEDVLDDLSDRTVEVIIAERVARAVERKDEHGGRSEMTAHDALVLLRHP